MLVVGALVVAVLVTAAITYRPSSSEGPEASNWKGAVVPGAVVFVGDALLGSVPGVLFAVIGLVLMAAGVAGLVRSRRRSHTS